MREIRVFPRRTRATPTDELAYYGPPDLFAEADRVDVSVTFTADLPRAESLARQWQRVAPVRVGGPAFRQPGGEFVPGRYLRPGYVITSRGCPNRCWFCEVWKRESGLRELPIRDGWNVQDDNLLACSEAHIRAVFAMLARQKHRGHFTGGLEAARLADWHVDLLAGLRPRPAVFFAYDAPDEYEPLVLAAHRLWAAGFTPASHRVRCYVLIGFPGDRREAAEARLHAVVRLGMTPAAMLYQGRTGEAPSPEWRAFLRRWTRPAIIHAKNPHRAVA
jgi:hypothetical protein